MSTERSYYLAHGESEQKVRDFYAKRRAAFMEANDLAKELGGSAAAVSYAMIGVFFDGAAPDRWTKKGNDLNGAPYYAPLRRSKAGKDAVKRMHAVKVPDGRLLHSLFSNDGGHLGEGGGGIFLAYVSAELIGDKAVISVPNGMDFVPPEAAPLKMSEYWALKETAHPRSGTNDEGR